MPTDAASASRAPLPASILSQGPNLIVSIHAALDDEELVRLQRESLERVGRDRSRGILIDVAALDVLDSFAARTLADLANAAQLRGAQTVVVGIAPEVAMTLVRLGVRIPLTRTALNLEEGLKWLGRDRPAGAVPTRLRPCC
jgi:rsbT antagonist protein RsbS